MRSGLKRLVVWGYCLGWIPADRVATVFKRFGLQGA
jgi:hypothetical protein